MNTAAFIGLRFLRSPRQDRSVAIITWISAAGVMLGVTALIITISVMNGFRANLVLAVTGSTPHLLVTPEEGPMGAEARREVRQRLQGMSGVVATAPYLSRQAFVLAHGQYRAVLLRGLDPDQHPGVTDLQRFIRVPGSRRASRDAAMAAQARERVEALRQDAPGGEGILLGQPLAAALGLETGDPLVVISTEERVTPMGPVPLMKRFRLAGTFETGIAGTDEVVGYVDYRLAQKLFRMGEATTGVAARVASPERIDAAAFRQALPGTTLRTWQEENRNVFQVMRLEKLGLFVILTLIIVVSFFNIIASLITLVLEKTRAIATLKAMGASNGLIRRIFFMQGVWIGTVGTLAGLTLGLMGTWALATFDIISLPPGVFPLVSRLPVKVDWLDLVLITGCSFAICMLVTLYPATRAARTQPVENLRYE